MDPSTRREFLLGDLRIEKSTMTTDEWVDLFYAIVDKIKAKLPYYDGFQELIYYIDDAGASVNKVSLSAKMEGLQLRNIRPNKRFLLLYRDTPIKSTVEGKTVLKQEMLFIDKLGKMYAFEGKYVHLTFTDASSETYHLIEAQILELDVPDLIDLFETKPRLPFSLLRTLLTAIEGAIGKASHRIQNLKSDQELLNSIFLKIQ